MKHSLIAILALAVPAVSQAGIIAGPIVNPTNGHSYFQLSADTWTGSEAAAVALGGHLATVRSADENAFIETSFGFVGNVPVTLWIGLNDVAAGPFNFVWSSGEAVTYTNWAGGEPNNFQGIERYAHLYKVGNLNGAPVGSWNDLPDDPTNVPPGDFGPAFGVVEVVPEPTLLPAFGLLALPLALRRR